MSADCCISTSDSYLVSKNKKEKEEREKGKESKKVRKKEPTGLRKVRVRHCRIPID